MMDKTIFSAVTEYWDNRALHFDGAASHIRHDDEWEKVLSSAFQSPEPCDVLDLGTGTGACAIVASRLGHRVTAVDGSAQMMARAQEIALAQSLEIRFIRGAIENLSLPQESFDIVTIRNVLWTVPDPSSILASARKMLRSSGRIVVADGLWSAAPAERSKYPNELADALPLHRGLLEEEGGALLEAAGFQDPKAWHHLFERHPYPGQIPFFVLSAAAT